MTALADKRDSSHLAACRLCEFQPTLCQRKKGKTNQAIVLDYPTVLEAKKGRLLEGDTGRLLKQTLASIGVDINDLHVVTALNCKPSASKPKELRTAMECCRARLLRELRSLGVQKVLCCGTIGYTALTSTDKIPRMDKVHGRWMPVYGMQLIATYSPTRVLIDPELFRDFSRTVNKFFTSDGREPWPKVRVHTIRWPHEFKDWLDEFGSDPLSCDIETDGFSANFDNIIAVGFGHISDDNSGDIAILDQELLEQYETWELIADQLTNGFTDFHNARFDLKFLCHIMKLLGIDFDLAGIGDTMLLNYCVDERPMGRYGAHSLKNMSRVRYDAPDYDIDMGKWIVEWKSPKTPEWRKRQMIKELHLYLSMDCYYTARLGRDLLQEVEDESPALLNLYETLHIPGTLALAEIEHRGVKLDRDYLEGLAAQLTKESNNILRKIREYVENPDFNPASSTQMHKLLYKDWQLPIIKSVRKGKYREGPTSQPILRTLRSKFPEFKEIIDLIIRYRQLQKTLGTYIYGFLDRVEADGRIRCSYLQHGTVTGRLSSANPNLQNIPDKSHFNLDIRKAFIPTWQDGYIIEGDYNQLELRVAAHTTQDKELIKAYVDDRDFHSDTSQAVLHKEASAWERSLVKNIVFGALFGRGAESIAFGPEMDHVVEIGEQRWTLNETKVFFKRFFSHYPQLRDWQNNQRTIAYREQRIETLMGRVRRFPFISHNDNGAVGRQAINTPIQSVASDITFDALIRIHHRLKKLNARVGRVVAHVVMTVHDSIIAECHPKYLKPVVKIFEEEMQRVPIKSNVPFKAKFGVGHNWSECK